MDDSDNAVNSTSFHELGPAVTVSLLLSNWVRYSLSERVWYHFCLTDALTGSREQTEQLPKDKTDQNRQQLPQQITSGSAPWRTSAKISKNEDVCGVVSLLECIPTKQLHKLSKRQKRELKTNIRNFNLRASIVRKNKEVFCHEPERLPLPLNKHTRVFFAYEVTRIAFCVDASPTLTSTFGFSGSASNKHSYEKACCPLDRLPSMARCFFASLIDPIMTTNKRVWQPNLAVTVLAIYPRACSGTPSSILVRDFRVTDTDSAALLANKLEEWIFGEVEAEIARHLSCPNLDAPGSLLSSYDAGVIPMHSSSLRDLLDAGDAALTSLSSEARPCIVIATDCRSISCEGTIDFLSDTDRVDTPFIVLDVSNPESHNRFCTTQQNLYQKAREEEHAADGCDFQMMNYDPGGAMFPLHCSDDSEALYSVCAATGGCFFDSQLLHEAATAKAGVVDPSSPLSHDHFFSFKRHNIHANAVQWYVLFSLSQLSPTMYSSTMGKLAPPEYVKVRLVMDENPDVFRKHAGSTNVANNVVPSFLSDVRGGSNEGRHGSNSMPGYSSDIQGSVLTRKALTRTVFSTYIVNPISIYGILVMRVKEGYVAKQYGQKSNDPDRVSVQMILPLDLGLVLHYELSYKALPGELWIGFAHIKIELSGDPAFIAMVKNDFLNQGMRVPLTTAQQVSARLCKLLRAIRKEDMLQSHLQPIKWSDQLSASDTPFVRRLATLSTTQRKRHFRRDEFDCVCIGRMPWAHDDEFLQEFQNTDNGENALNELMDGWATQTVVDGKRFVKQTSSVGGVAGYSIIELKRSSHAKRLFTVILETFQGNGSSNRLALLACLKHLTGEIKEIEVLPKQLEQFLVRSRVNLPVPFRCFDRKETILMSQLHHATWFLVKDNELLRLLMRRRSEIGKFLLLESGSDHASFAKLAYTDSNETSDPGDLVQYQLAVLEDKVVVDVHMESEGGIFYPFRKAKQKLFGSQKKTSFVNKSKFEIMIKILKTRDEKCGHALRCRTKLLSVFDDGVQAVQRDKDDALLSCVRKLLAYSSRLSIRLRFFNADSGSANTILQSLTEDMLLSQSFDAKVAKLPVDPYSLVDELDQGSWFVIEFDKQTTSMVHFSLSEHSEVSEIDGRGYTYREMTFFTFGITDLYNKRDDVDDDESDEGHISEHFCVSKICDAILASHRLNYSAAAYMSLRHDGPSPRIFFDLDDFAEVMKPLNFVEVAEVIVGGERFEQESDSKLLKMISTVLHPITDELFCLFYDGAGQNNLLHDFSDDESNASAGEASSAEISSLATEDDDNLSHSQLVEGNVPTEDSSLGIESNDGESLSPNFVSSPIFVRFLLDDKPVSIPELANIQESSMLKALVSVFAKSSCPNIDLGKINRSQLPVSHVDAAIEIASLLNAYVAEQTLERLRMHGLIIWKQEHNLRLVKACLRRARNVVASAMNIYFYVGKIDELVAASAPAGSSLEVDEGFNFLYSELQNINSLLFKPYGNGGGFLVDSKDSDSSALSYWCAINIRRARGVVAAKIHHPAGPQQASELMNAVLEAISLCCHRVNQLLLLRKLHQSRSASRLLIPPDIESPMGKMHDSRTARDPTFHDGSFCCPVVFRTSFELFHRCATNPAQVARSLAATVLHIFAVSNRKQLFVYKDERGSIFYMGLSTRGGGVEADGQIDLIVHGLDNPGPSVTSQLKRLLQKRLLHIAVDMLSSVLTKNPHYNWRHADIRFIRDFEANWKPLDNERTDSGSCERTYAFPCTAYDPGMILLYFRQNLCGSTFFHRLVSSEWTEDHCEEALCENHTLCLSPTDLLFYYNNSPSALDPKFQSQCTLTDKGLRLSQQAGAGIAIIELNLFDRKGRKTRELISANKPDTVESCINFPHNNLHFIDVSYEMPLTDKEGAARFFLQVKITDTALKRDVVHEWVLLTLNQALVGWTIERILERKQRALFKPISTNSLRKPLNIELAKKVVVNEISLGLPALATCLKAGEALPHPAIHKSEHVGCIRASSVGTLALDLLDKVILEQIIAETKGKLSFGTEAYDIIRLSRNSKPQRVQLIWDATRQNALVLADHDFLKDSPIECPEYIIFCCFPEYIESRKNQDIILPKLFDEVFVGGDRSVEIGDSKSLHALKERNFFATRRSFGFILSVSRDRRLLLAYNWSTIFFKQISSRLREHDSASLVLAGHQVDRIQRCALKDLSPPLETSFQNNTRLDSSTRNSTVTRTNEMVVGEADRHVDESPFGQQRRIARPLFIRKPKLVGKSVEGAAVHAVAASRARASANRFRGNLQSGTSSIVQKAPVDQRHLDRLPAASKRASAIPQPPRISEEREIVEADQELNRVRSEFFAVVGKSILLRQFTIMDSTHHFLIRSLMPMKQTQTQHVAASVATFLLCRARLAWNDISEMLPFPVKLTRTFLPSFAHAVTRLRQVSFMPLKTSNDAIFLVGRTRKVKFSKCFVVIGIKSINFTLGRQKKNIVSLEGRILHLRRSKKQGQTSLNTNLLLEKDSAGLDKVSVDLHNSLRDLDGLLFDHACSVMERSMKSIDGDLEYHEVFRLLRQLILRYPLVKMMLMRSNYKSFEAKIVLSSYKDRLVDMFDGPSIFSYLSSNLRERNMVRCGPTALCFKREIIVGVTHSICFLTCDKQTPEQMQLVILCRTQGKDLYEFMFREGSNVAISILDNIAVEAAGLAFKELRYAAISLHRDGLWHHLSTALPNEAPPIENIAELLALSSKKAISFFFESNVDLQRFDSICKCNEVIGLQHCLNRMRQDPCFAPAWSIVDDAGLSRQNLFYMSGEDVFLLFRTSLEGIGLEIDVIQREAMHVKSPSAARMAIQKLVNFLLHFIWTEMITSYQPC